MLRKLLLVIWAVALIMVPSQVGQAQSDQPVVSIQPTTLEVGINQTAEIAVAIKNISGLYGMELQISFDPTLLEVEDANPDMSGIQVSLGTFLEPGLLLFNTVDNDLGTIKYVMSQMDPAEPKNGEGILLVIKVKAKAAGTSTVNITSAVLASQDGMAIASQLESGQIIVTEQGPSGDAPTEFAKVDDGGAVILATPQGGELATPAATIEVATIPDAAVETTRKPVEQMVDSTPTSEPTTTIDEPISVETVTTPQTLFSRFGWVIGGMAIVIIGLLVALMIRKKRL